MPIEDIQYLLKNSEEDEFIMYIDSSQRDKVLYPSPNQYSVTFTEPFQNVCGVTVLDCLVPRTMYNVDLNNNTLMVMFLNDVGGDNGWTTITVPPADYTLDNFVKYMNSYLDSSQLSVKTVGKDIRSTGKIYLESAIPFRIDLQNSSISEVLGMDEPCTKSRDGTNYEFLSSHLVQSLRQAPETQATTIAVQSGSPGVYTVSTDEEVSQTVTFPKTCELETVAVSSSAITGLTIVDAVAGRTMMVLTAKSTPTTFQADNAAYVLFSSGTPYTVRAEFGVTVPLIDVVTSLDTAWLQPMDEAGSNFVTAITVSNPVYRIFCPGLLCLSGERCILLRSPTIEQHINSSYIYGSNSPGLALITLGVTGFTTQRLDFTSIKYKSFFPIGKLPKMSITFETTRGSLYDFKGVNHTIVIALKYLVPKRRAEFDNRVLNTNYNPDYLSYLLEHHHISEELHTQRVQDEEIDEFYEKRFDLSDASGDDSEVDIDTL